MITCFESSRVDDFHNRITSHDRCDTDSDDLVAVVFTDILCQAL